jgi:hypothetical protein
MGHGKTLDRTGNRANRVDCRDDAWIVGRRDRVVFKQYRIRHELGEISRMPAEMTRRSRQRDGNVGTVCFGRPQSENFEEAGRYPMQSTDDLRGLHSR